MSLGLRKISAILVVCLTALGILLSLFFMFETWHYRLPVTEKLQGGVDQITSMLQISDEGLVVIDQVVKNVYTSTIYIDEATSAFSETVVSTSQFMNSAEIFVGNNLLTTITNTQIALGSAQASARVIDNILTTLSRIPLIGITYNPTTPLNSALGEVSASLNPLQTTLKNFKTNLGTTRQNMQDFSGQISVLDKNILYIQTNLDQAQTTINKYRSQIATINSWLVDVKTGLPRWTSILAWVITLIIVWLIIIQVSLMLQAITQIGEPRPGQEKPYNTG